MSDQPRPAADAILAAESLSKSFGRRKAVADVSFEVFPGEVFGFLGPNGAGKTTTIRMLVGLARPDSGRIRIGGLDVHRDFTRAMRRVGCIVESPDLYKYLTGRENLQHFARMLGAGAADRIDDLARLVALEQRLEEPVSTYSLGMRQRLGIAQALLGDPDLLILDEPANGLDPAGIREIRHLIRRLAGERGIAVFLSSHLLAEVEQTCDRVAIIHRGKTLSTGPVRELLEAANAPLRVNARPAQRACEILAAFSSQAPQLEGPDTVSAAVARERVPEAVRALAREGVEVFSLERRPASLEEVFLEVTGGETV